MLKVLTENFTKQHFFFLIFASQFVYTVQQQVVAHYSERCQKNELKTNARAHVSKQTNK